MAQFPSSRSISTLATGASWPRRKTENSLSRENPPSAATSGTLREPFFWGLSRARRPKQAAASGLTVDEIAGSHDSGGAACFWSSSAATALWGLTPFCSAAVPASCGLWRRAGRCERHTSRVLGIGLLFWPSSSSSDGVSAQALCLVDYEAPTRPRPACGSDCSAV